MNFPDITDDPEDTQYTPAERARAASRSTWVSVVVNVVLTTLQTKITPTGTNVLRPPPHWRWVCCCWQWVWACCGRR